MRTLGLHEIEITIKTMADVALENERYFCDLDAKCGDADFGVSLADGFRAVLANWGELDRSSISALLLNVGKLVTSHVGGCSGPIWGTCFLRSGIAIKGKDEASVEDLVMMLRGAIEGMMARGGAKLGDKTLIDALSAATDSLAKLNGSTDCVSALQAASVAASEMVETSRDWIARRGRQSFTGDRSQGTHDPGMVAVATMLRAVAQALARQPASQA